MMTEKLIFFTVFFCEFALFYYAIKTTGLAFGCFARSAKISGLWKMSADCALISIPIFSAPLLVQKKGHYSFAESGHYNLWLTSMFTKWTRTLGFLLLSISTHSMAGDASLDRFISSKNKYTINERGYIEVAPDFKAFVAAASTNKRSAVSGTSFVVTADLTILGEFSQFCRVLPAHQFFDYLTKELKKDEAQNSTLTLLTYRFITEEKHFNPTSFMQCENSEPDFNKWNSVLRLPTSPPFVLAEQITNKGFRYFYVTSPRGVNFFF